MGGREIIFRPVDLFIYDEQTKEPVEGIIVKVSNVAYYEKIFYFLGIPIDSDVRKTYYPIEEFKTNEEGHVQIPMYAYKAKWKHYLYGQDIYVNVEQIEETLRKNADEYWPVVFYDKENQYYFRPFEKYKAAMIQSWPHLTDDDKIYKQLEKTKPYIKIIFNGHIYPTDLKEPPSDFNCDHEEFNIYLERFTEI
jgi:hypothetical protein